MKYTPAVSRIESDWRGGIYHPRLLPLRRCDRCQTGPTSAGPSAFKSLWSGTVTTTSDRTLLPFCGDSHGGGTHSYYYIFFD